MCLAEPSIIVDRSRKIELEYNFFNKYGTFLLDLLMAH